MTACVTCKYGSEVRYSKEKDRTTGILTDIPKTVKCGKPGYKRAYRVNVRAECPQYEKRERNAEKQGV